MGRTAGDSAEVEHLPMATLPGNPAENEFFDERFGPGLGTAEVDTSAFWF